MEKLHMQFKSVVKAGFVAVTVMGAAAASAVPITFDFSNGRSESNATYHNSLALSQSDLNLNVTAATQGLLGTSSAQVARTANGLGVKGGSSNTQVDGGFFHD